MSSNRHCIGHEVPGVVVVLRESIAGRHQLIAAKTQPAKSNKQTTTTQQKWFHYN